jgi:hypothetical protein
VIAGTLVIAADLEGNVYAFPDHRP